MIEELGVNILQNTAIGSNTGQVNTCKGPTTDQFPYAQEANAQESCKSQVDPAPRSHSPDNFETSLRASEQEQEYSPYLMPTSSITSDVKSWQDVDASRQKPNVNSHAVPLPFPMPMEEMDANILQRSATGSSTSQEPTTDRFSYAQEANAEEFCKPQVDPVPRSHSADNFKTSVHGSSHAPETPEYSPYLMPSPSITSDVKSWEAVDPSRRNPKSNVDSVPSPPPFPMPNYSSKPEHGMSQNFLIQFLVAYLIF